MVVVVQESIPVVLGARLYDNPHTHTHTGRQSTVASQANAHVFGL